MQINRIEGGEDVAPLSRSCPLPSLDLRAELNAPDVLYLPEGSDLLATVGLGCLQFVTIAARAGTTATRLSLGVDGLLAQPARQVSIDVDALVAGMPATSQGSALQTSLGRRCNDSPPIGQRRCHPPPRRGRSKPAALGKPRPSTQRELAFRLPIWMSAASSRATSSTPSMLGISRPGIDRLLQRPASNAPDRAIRANRQHERLARALDITLGDVRRLSSHRHRPWWALNPWSRTPADRCERRSGRGKPCR